MIHIRTFYDQIYLYQLVRHFPPLLVLIVNVQMSSIQLVLFLLW
jgi:hypothetical protein